VSLSLTRYTLTIVLGFAVDAGVTLLLSRLCGVPLPIATACGFLLALGLNYLLFELWSFSRQESALSPERFARTILAAGCALAVRVAVVWCAGALLGGSLKGSLLAVITGAGASFIVNFVLVRRVFNAAGGGNGGAGAALDRSRPPAARDNA
jgi:putative flippase GtrA